MSEAGAIACVTGGGTGIGAACCRELAARGFAVGIHYNRSEAEAGALSEELKGSFLIQSDLSRPEGVDRVYEALKEKGGVDVLVNNAGMTIDNPLFSATLEDFDAVVAANMRSAWHLIKRLSRLMIRKKRGRIINISSVVAGTGNPTQSIYGMTKAALENLTKTASQELAPYGILVNAVAPGFIETRMTGKISEEHRQKVLERIPLQRFGRPEEVAEVVGFLATGASYCTGTVFHVNGGLYGG